MPEATNGFLLLVVRCSAASSKLATNSSNALVPSSDTLSYLED